MDLYILIVISIFNLWLGLRVFRNNMRSATNILFFLFIIVTIAWAIANYISTVYRNELNVEQALLWVRLTMFFAVPQAVVFFFLVHTIPEAKIALKKKYFYGLIFFAVITMIVALSSLLFVSVTAEDGKAITNSGPGMALFLPVAAGSVIAGLIKLIKKYRKATGVEKIQLRYLFLGLSLMFVFILTFNFALVVFFKNLSFVTLAPLFTLPFFVSIFYAITRHRLMDIRFIIKKTTVFVASIVCVLLIALALYWLEINFLKDAIGLGVWGPMALLISLIIYNPIKKQLERFANKYLFTSLYDTEKTIQQLTKSLASTIHLNEVTSTIVNVMNDTMKPEKIGVMLRRGAGKESTLSYMAAQLVNFDEKREIPLVENTFLNNYLQKTKQPLVYDEVNMITNLAQREKTQLAKTAKEMKENGVAIALPLIAKSQLVGIILLGNKISRDAYTKEDFKLLEIISSQAAIAIENAILYNNMKVVVDQQTKDIREKSEKMEQLLKLRSEFLDIASHQLRTPVSVINGTISMIRDGDIAKLPATEQQKFFNNIFLKGKKLESIISDILAASEMDGEFTVTPGDKVDIAKLLEKTVETYKFDAEEKKLQLTLQIPSPAPAPVPGNAKYLEQVMDNLLSNALHYTEKGSITVRLQKKDDACIVFSVADTGIGVPKKDQPRLFDKFVRGENARNMYTDGSGLGLFIIKKIVDAHPGGKVWVESEEGKGSVFYVQLCQSK